jgi:membrane-associated protease RseP (regulator of RpoE activity)
MADPESLRDIARTRAPFSAWLGMVLLFALFGIIVLAIIGPSPRGDTYEQKRAKAREEKLKTVQDEAKSLTSYGWIDKNKGVARIPIDRAMELTVADLAQKKPAPAGPIATPPPVAPASAAPSPSPAPSASPSPSGTAKPTSVAGPSSEIHNQPAAAANPPAAPPGTQPGASATPTPP